MHNLIGDHRMLVCACKASISCDAASCCHSPPSPPLVRASAFPVGTCGMQRVEVGSVLAWTALVLHASERQTARVLARYSRAPCKCVPAHRLGVMLHRFLHTPALPTCKQCKQRVAEYSECCRDQPRGAGSLHVCHLPTHVYNSLGRSFLENLNAFVQAV